MTPRTLEAMAVARPTAARIGADGEAPREVSGPARRGRKTKLLVKRVNRENAILPLHQWPPGALCSATIAARTASAAELIGGLPSTV